MVNDFKDRRRRIGKVCQNKKKSTVTVQNVGLNFYSWRNFYGLVAVAACDHAFGFLLIAITHLCYIGENSIQKFVKNECWILNSTVFLGWKKNWSWWIDASCYCLSCWNKGFKISITAAHMIKCVT